MSSKGNHWPDWVDPLWLTGDFQGAATQNRWYCPRLLEGLGEPWL